tara:strand:+ start:3384 stop:3554 length:171 start_codon:yes stop_codon:yes gene_type:complete
MKIKEGKYLDLSMVGKVRLVDRGGNTIKVLSKEKFKKQYYVVKPKKMVDTYVVGGK